MKTPTSLILAVLTISGACPAAADDIGRIVAQADTAKIPDTKTPDPTQNTAPIKGAETMGDKNRSGPDGWVQAPVSRDEAPATDKTSAGETRKPTPASAPVSSKPMAAGDDPGTPVTNPATGPGQRHAAPN